MSLEEREAYRTAGIGVLANKLDVRVVQLSIGVENQWLPGPLLEPLERLRDAELAFSESARMRVEDYVSAHLAGLAAEFLYVLARRRQLQKSQGDAVVHMKFWRRLLECGTPENDRAFAIAFGYLGKCDAGDSEATVYRLWQRAIELLRASPQREQLDRLTRHLLKVRRLSGEEVTMFLSG